MTKKGNLWYIYYIYTVNCLFFVIEKFSLTLDENFLSENFLHFKFSSWKNFKMKY